MRDAHRMKEKFDVSLDNRQVVSLLIAGIIVMGAVFVLGVVVGKQLAGNAQAAAAPDLLSALDANAQALQQARETESPLTFQDELMRKSAAEHPSAEPRPGTVTVAIPPPAPKPKPVEPAPAVAEPTEEHPPAASPTDDDYAPIAAAKPAESKVAESKPAAKPAESKPEPKVAESKPAARPAESKPAAKPAESKPEPKVAESKPAARPAESKPLVTSGKVESAPVATRSTPAAGGNMKEAIARAVQKPTEAVAGGAFTLQLSAFQNRPEADHFASKLRDRGYAPFIVAAEVPGKGTWYRVRMGSFPSKDAASRYLTDFKRETQLSAFVAGAN